MQTSEDKKLTPLLDALAKEPAKKYHEQKISFESYCKVIDYIKEKNKDLFLTINAMSPNSDVYDFYHNYSDTPTKSLTIFRDINSIMGDVKSNSIDNEVTFCIRLARAFERDGNLNTALYLMKLAQQKRPNGKIIDRKIKEYSNKLKRK
jgi:hypothetical protein